MPDILPFRGLRYNPAIVADLSSVVCGPYDVISPAEREALSRKSQYNAVLIELAEKGKAPVGAPSTGSGRAGEASGLHAAASASAYEAVASTLQAWVNVGLLARDQEESYTVLEEKFQVEAKTYSRTSLWGAVKLSPFGQGKVHPHEKTFPGPKEDRYKVLSATRMNLSPVFGMTSDPGGEILSGLVKICSGKPLAVASYQGVELRVHRLREEEAPASFWKAVRSQPVVIADGHHRYETALKFRDEAGGGDSDRVMMALVPISSPGLLVQPTHRVARLPDAAALKRFIETVRASFDFSPLNGPGPKDWEEEVEALKGPGRLGLVLKENGKAVGYSLKPRDWKACLFAQKKRQPDHGDDFYALDVVCLANLLPESGVTVTPDRDPARAAEAVCVDDRSLAFLVRAVGPEDVYRLAAAGERFPEKTTYFYPKLPTGVVFRPL